MVSIEMGARLKLIGAAAAVVILGMCLISSYTAPHGGRSLSAVEKARVEGADEDVEECQRLLRKDFRARHEAMMKGNEYEGDLLEQAEARAKKARNVYDQLLGGRSKHHCEAYVSLAEVAVRRKEEGKAVELFVKALSMADLMVEVPFWGSPEHILKMARLEAKAMSYVCQRCLFALARL